VSAWAEDDLSSSLFTEFLPDGAGAQKESKFVLLDGWLGWGEFVFMTTTLSSRGQVVLPRLARSRLGLVTGTKFDCEITGESILLKPRVPKASAPVYVKDKISGLRVAQVTKRETKVTSAMVRELLAEFP
jgi:bifunctional DNA-binding transcriptional regulator/antitoxin component of YhaV-PrlF toxin-antitoxin module